MLQWVKPHGTAKICPNLDVLKLKLFTSIHCATLLAHFEMIPSSRQSAASSLADSVLQVRFDVVCLFTFLESQVDRSYPYLARYVALRVRSISSFSMHSTYNA